MRKLTAVLAVLLLGAPHKPELSAQSASSASPLLPDSMISAIANELAGETAKRNLEFIATLHRSRGSRGWHAAGAFIVERLLAYGLKDAHIESFPADGKIFYGTQRSRRPWDAEFAELWELGESGREWTRAVRLASWDAMPVSLAQDSESGQATAALVDVGDGTSESDYAGKDVRGRLVLVAQQPGAVQHLAVDRFGAAGIVSYAQNQRTAWWSEDENLVRWGHLDSFSATPAFGFMISLKQGRALRQRLARGEEIRLEAKVVAGQHPGAYEVVTATIPGADPRLSAEEIAFSCHLDHQRPGANDNASGCVAILEAARTLAKLIAEGRLARPARTLRFIWPPEIEGTLALLNARPELGRRIKAVIHMDMVGGGPVTKAIFHVTRGPGSLPSFVYDVGAAFGELVNRESAQFAGTGRARFPLVSPEGGKEALQADFAEFTIGSDHEVYTEGSYRIPAIYLNDWPDRYIHTNFDTSANVDATKLERAAFIGAASGYYLATLRAEQVPVLLALLQQESLKRTATMMERRASLDPMQGAILEMAHFGSERAILASVASFAPVPENLPRDAAAWLSQMQQVTAPLSSLGGLIGINNGRDSALYRRTPEPRGPMTVFGYDYLEARLGAEKTAGLGLLRYEGLRGGGGEYAYEVLNLVDGRRTDVQITYAVSAIYGPVPHEMVTEYLAALESAGVISRVRP